MKFVHKHANMTPIVDTVFKVVSLAKEAKLKYGKENVVDATIGSLYNEEGKLVALDTVFTCYNNIFSFYFVFHSLHSPYIFFLVNYYRNA